VIKQKTGRIKILMKPDKILIIRLSTIGDVLRTIHLKGKILHFVYRDIFHQLKTVDYFSRILAKTWQKQGEKSNLFTLIVKPPVSFLITYFWKRGILDGMPGFIIVVITSYYVFLKHAKLCELYEN
jgi:hypothetical protein